MAGRGGSSPWGLLGELGKKGEDERRPLQAGPGPGNLQEETSSPRNPARAWEEEDSSQSSTSVIWWEMPAPRLGPLSMLRLWRFLRKKHLVESAAVPNSLPDREERKATRDRGDSTPPSLLQPPHSNLGPPFKRPVGAFTLALCTCRLPCTNTCMCAHTHTCIHTHTVSFQSLLKQQVVSHLHHHPLHPGVPRTQPQAWHMLAFPGF